MDETTTKAIITARSLIDMKKREQAANILRSVIRTNPGLEEAWFLLGEAASVPQEQIDSFGEVLRINPNNSAARQQLAVLKAANSENPSSVENTFGPRISWMDNNTANTSSDEDASRPFFRNDIQGLETAPASSAEWLGRLHDQMETTSDPDHLVRLALVEEMEAAPTFVDETEKPAPDDSKKYRLPRHIFIIAGLIGLVLLMVSLSIWLIQLGKVKSADLSAAATVLPSPIPPTIPPATLQPTSTSEAGYAAVFRTTACPFSVPMGTRVKCGVVNVPLDRAKNNTDLIELPVVLYKSKKANADVVVFLQDGPGKESINWSLANFDDFVTPMLDGYDMLFFDARGTGRSKPGLDCPELNTILLDSYFKSRSPTDTFADFKSQWTKCRAGFAARNLDPLVFTTLQSAADVRDIVRAMGYEKVNLLGLTYGTRLGLIIMRDYPEIVRAAVLDSAVPVQAQMFNRRASDVQVTLQKVFSDCAASASCNAAYPELEKVFNGLLATFNKKPVTIQAYNSATGFHREIRVAGSGLLAAFAWGMHTSDLVSALPMAIYDISNGDYTFLSYALGIAGSEYADTSLGTYFASVCPEQVYATTSQQLDQDLGLTWPYNEFAMSGLFDSSQNIFDLCNMWGAQTYDPRDSQPVTANLPSLVLAGRYDPLPPPLTGKLLAAELPNSYYSEIPGLGGDVTIGNTCPLSLVKSFLQDPANAPDSSCLNDIKFEFFLPHDGQIPVPLEPMQDPAKLMHGMVPQGWKKDSQVFTYSRDAYLFDSTLISYTSFVAPRTAALSVLSRTYGGQGFDDPPYFYGFYTSNKLAWYLFRSEFKGQPAMIGLAQISNSQTLGVVMVTSRSESRAFYQSLLLPVLDASAP